VDCQFDTQLTALNVFVGAIRSKSSSNKFVMQLPPPHCLKAVELGIIDPEAVVPREWIYDFYVLCPATLEDCIGFFRQFGATTEVDDNTYIALLAGGFFRRTLDTSAIACFLNKRFSKHALLVDTGMRRCIEELTSADTTSERAREICKEVLTPYQDLADRLLGELPAPNEFSWWR
jgi:hypothetical protein